MMFFYVVSKRYKQEALLHVFTVQEVWKVF